MSLEDFVRKIPANIRYETRRDKQGWYDIETVEQTMRIESIGREMWASVVGESEPSCMIKTSGKTDQQIVEAIEHEMRCDDADGYILKAVRELLAAEEEYKHQQRMEKQ